MGDGNVPRHLSPNQRALRNRLRAHGRQLGDRRDAKSGTQGISHLVQECAYEHWHRRLFARFLAETDLLIEPTSGVPISLDEAQELARDSSTDWLELASDYAERMLPQIFRKGDPVLDIALPRETRSELEDLLKTLPSDVFLADDSLGWVYQFWQSDKKDDINSSEVKIGADELPAVTQLFTEDYLVLFLLHNTLGAWWAGKQIATRPDLSLSASSEDEIRIACETDGVSLTYLRFTRDSDFNGALGSWRPASGTFETWPTAAKDLTILDPCMGSGHFLRFAFPMLVAFRMAEEGISREVAVGAVLRDNLFGLEIDPRCTQIAAFNLAFAAWRMVGYRALPRLNLACSGLPIGVSSTEWLRLAERASEVVNPTTLSDSGGTATRLKHALANPERITNSLQRLYDLFVQAPWLGSLIEPRKVTGDILQADFSEIESFLPPMFSEAATDEVAEIAVAAHGMVQAAQLLSRQFDLVVTNVPYLGAARQDAILRAYTKEHYATYAADLATCMLKRCLAFATPNGTVATVSSQSWLFMKPYTKMRAELLRSCSWDFVARLGEHAFSSPQAAGAFVALVGWTKTRPQSDHAFLAIDASTLKAIEDKARALASGGLHFEVQAAEANNPDCRITFNASLIGSLLSDFADAYKGIATGDIERFVHLFWELPNPRSAGFEFLQGAPTGTESDGGRSDVLLWENGDGALRKFVAEKLGESGIGAWIRGEPAWGHRGVAVGQVRSLPATLYLGDLFDENTAAIIPKNDSQLGAIWEFCSSGEYSAAVRSVDHSLKVPSLTLLKVRFDLEHWTQVSLNRGASSLPTPISSNATQWLFSGHPRNATNPLHVGVARLVGYHWPRQMGSSFLDCPALEPDAIGMHETDDGIVCLNAIKGDAPAEERLTALLADSFGADWSASKLAALLAELQFAGGTLDDWLREGFFQQHCELFHHRPFIWHISDGRNDGFHALVNYHRLAAPRGEGKRTLEKLIYSYLGDWIDRQRADQKTGIEGADGRLAAAGHLQAELRSILEGDRPYDIFVRWKPLHEQPIGWQPDINDGIRINIRPFMTARPLGARSSNACVLRSVPKIKWDKDRGKEPSRDKHQYPWFWSWDGATADFAGGSVFDGNRWNNLHYGNAMKLAVRNRNSSKAAREL
ncbi:MAG: N-6 DNA methylase [Candidatus Baltobacteraceae bacterium]